MRQLLSIVLPLTALVASAQTSITTNNQITTTTTTTTITKTVVEKQEEKKTWTPFRICVLPFTTIDQRAQRQFLNRQSKPIAVPVMKSLDQADRASIHSVMQGYVKLVDAHDQAATNEGNRTQQIQEQQFEQEKMLQLYQNVALGTPRPTVIGAEYLAAFLGQYPEVFSCTSPELVGAAMRKVAQISDFPRNSMLRLAYESGTTHLVIGTVSDLQVAKTTFTGYGISTQNLRYTLDLIVKVYDLGQQRTVYSQVYKATRAVQLTPNVTEDNIDANTFRMLMETAAQEAAEELYELCKPGPANRISVIPLPPEPNPPITEDNVNEIVTKALQLLDQAGQKLQTTSADAEAAIKKTIADATQHLNLSAEQTQKIVAAAQAQLQLALQEQQATTQKHLAQLTQSTQDLIRNMARQLAAAQNLSAEQLTEQLTQAINSVVANATQHSEKALEQALAKATEHLNLTAAQTQELANIAKQQLQQLAKDTDELINRVAKEASEKLDLNTHQLKQELTAAISKAIDTVVANATQHSEEALQQALAKATAHLKLTAEQTQLLAQAAQEQLKAAVQQGKDAIAQQSQIAAQQLQQLVQKADELINQVANNAAAQLDLNTQQLKQELMAALSKAIDTVVANATQHSEEALQQALAKATEHLKLTAEQTQLLAQAAQEQLKATAQQSKDAIAQQSQAAAEHFRKLATSTEETIRILADNLTKKSLDDMSRLLSQATQQLDLTAEQTQQLVDKTNAAFAQACAKLATEAQNAIKQSLEQATTALQQSTQNVDSVTRQAQNAIKAATDQATKTALDSMVQLMQHATQHLDSASEISKTILAYAQKSLQEAAQNIAQTAVQQLMQQQSQHEPSFPEERPVTIPEQPQAHPAQTQPKQNQGKPSVANLLEQANED